MVNLGVKFFIDLKKAFNTVNHTILLKKLDHYGIRGIPLKWFESYLSNRKQQVSVNGCSSEELALRHGVPQGSVFGPLLFLIFINDLQDVSKHLIFYLFADDTNIYFESTDLLQIQKVVNRELRKVRKWLEENRLALNIGKTNFVGIKLRIILYLGLVEKSIKQESYVKVLGILSDSNLSWKFHLTELSKKLARTAGLFYKIRHYVPKDILMLLYHGLFASFLAYGISVWGSTFATYTDPIFTLQKRCWKLLPSIK